jgi:xylulokinase
MKTLVAGVDCSTQETKVLILDPGSGRVLERGRALHRVAGSGGARLSDHEDWWTALRSA